MDKSAVYEELKKNPKNVRFNRLCSAAELFGFRYRGGKRKPCDIQAGRYERNVEFSKCRWLGKTLSGKAAFKNH